MGVLYWALGILGSIAVLVLIISFICFYLTFFTSRRQEKNAPEFDIPPGKIYEPFREQMVAWQKEARNIPSTDAEITSFDGLKLKGKFYEYKKGAPIELMMHGYRGTSERDLCGGIQRCFKLGRSCLIIDQRACGRSEGHVITFGVKEHRDCLDWVDYIINNIDPDARIILCGISMGASTVLMASGKNLPKNVIGVLADCGYTSAEAIIKKVVKQIKLPPTLLYPFIKLGARLYGRFDLEESPAIENVKKSTLPTIFFHGQTDDFVPYEMSVENFNACNAEKELVSMPEAGHGLCFVIDPEKYFETLAKFTVEHYKVECEYQTNITDAKQ